MADREKLIIMRGDDKWYVLTFKDADGVAIDITGWTIFMTVKGKMTDADVDAIITETVTSHFDPTAGQTKVHISSTQSTVAAASYYYDIQVKKDDDEIFTVMYGDFVVRQDVTLRTS